VVFLVLDAQQGVTRIDKQLAGELALLGCGIVVVVNKWDLAKEAFRAKQVDGYEDEEEFRSKFRAAARRELFFLPDPPLLFVSARTGLRTEDLLDAAEGVFLRAGTAISTGKINRLVQDLMVKRPPRMVSGRRFKCYYVTQVSSRPVRFRLFCNSEERLEDAYQRYLVKGVHESFDLAGVPVFLDVVGKPKQQGRKYFAPPGTKPEDAPSAGSQGRPAKAGASGPREGKSRKAATPARKKSFSRWDKPRSLKGRAARQARK
ncbi:MAG: GTP-binding protein, partial [Verrucomicrobiota bacterium]